MRRFHLIFFGFQFLAIVALGRPTQIVDLPWDSIERASIYKFFALNCSNESWKAFFGQISKVKRKFSNSIDLKELERQYSSRSFALNDIQYDKESGRWSINGITDVKPTDDICRLYLAVLKSNQILKKFKKLNSSLLGWLVPLAHAQDQIEIDGPYLDYLKVTLFVALTAKCILITGPVIGAVCGITGAGAVGGTISISNKKLTLAEFLESDIEVTCSKNRTILRSKKLRLIINKGDEEYIKLENPDDTLLPVLDHLTIKKDLPIAYSSLFYFAKNCNSTEDAMKWVAKTKKKNFTTSRRSIEIAQLDIEMMSPSLLEPMSGTLTKPSPTFKELSEPTGRQ